MKSTSLLNQASHTQVLEDKKVTQSDCRLIERKKPSSCHLRKEKKWKTVLFFGSKINTQRSANSKLNFGKPTRSNESIFKTRFKKQTNF